MKGGRGGEILRPRATSFMKGGRREEHIDTV